jgi:biotin operon repressor
VVIRRIKILFHNVYKETLLIFRSKKLNIGKFFSFLLFFFFSQFFYEVITQFLRWYLGTFLVSIQFRVLISPFDNMFRVELFRSSFPMTNGKENIGETSEVVWRTDLNDTQQKIIKLLSEDHQLSAVKLAKKIGVASRNIENNIKKLKEYGILIRHGSPKNGYWEIVDKDLQE